MAERLKKAFYESKRAMCLCLTFQGISLQRKFLLNQSHYLYRIIKNAPSNIFSVYPPFQINNDENSIYIVNQDGESEDLRVFKYPIEKLIE